MHRYILNRYVLGFIALTILAVVLISYTGQQRVSLSPPEKLVKSLASPLETGVSKVTNGVNNFFVSVFSFGTIKEENVDLKKRISALEAENLLLREYMYQNLRLRELINFKDSLSGKYETASASVVAWNPSNTYKSVTINRGEKDGVRKNMAVVTSMGLVGHVINVSGGSAEVLLIIDNSDKSSAVGGLIQVPRTPGLIEGLDGGAFELKMNHISKDAAAREKQVVVTSGLGGVYPKGLPIGRITKVEIAANGLEKYAIVRPFVDFNRLEEVLVIKSVFGEDLITPSGGEEQ